MVDSEEAQRLLTAAEGAAAADDYASAERLLREAAAVQERTLGSSHPDLANTLNNLGVVCERAHNDDDAEQCYRRAYAIATSALAADHPFVATSRQNLEDFLAARGRSIEEVAAREEQQPAPSEQDVTPETRDARIEEEDASPEEQDNVAEEHGVLAEARAAGPEKQGPAYTEPKGAGPEEQGPAYTVLAALGVAIVMGGVGWFAWPSTLGSKPSGETHATTPVAAATPEAPQPAPAPTAPPPSPPPAEIAPSPPAAKRAPAKADSAASPTGAEARLCRTLSPGSGWTCDPLISPVSSGTVYFFTRIASSDETTVQHRWYFNDRLHQNVVLEIQPNSSGYRTYSRTTVGPERAGEWRVELRSEDGRVLGEERFTVR